MTSLAAVHTQELLNPTSFTYRIVVIVYLVQAVSLRRNIAVPRDSHRGNTSDQQRNST